MQQLRTLGMPLYFAQPPTGYADTADAWVNTGALVNRMNFAVDLTDEPAARRPRRSRRARRHDRRADAAKAWATAHLLRGQASDATSATLARGTDLASDRRAVARLAGVPAPLTYAVSASVDASGTVVREGVRERHPADAIGRDIMVSRRVFLRNGGLALVSLGFAPAFVARTAGRRRERGASC